jgi:nucleoside-diphosphate-sugar epimerase
MKALVTGGGGFLGSAIVRLLVARGDEVCSFSRGPHPTLEALGVTEIIGDLADGQTVAEAVRGCDLVFHVAAKAGVWGPYRDYHRTNVTGTANVLAACRAQRVRRLVYTSSPSVVHHGGDLEGVDESIPYPRHFLAAYPETKALAEQMVLKANGSDLATVALRPHLIWGPGDPHFVPRLLERARTGQLHQLGKKSKKVDTVYIDNAADAHLLAADRLAPGAAIAGRAYFIAQGAPLPVWDFINRVLATAGIAPVHHSIPFWLAYGAGTILEWAYRLLPLPGEPPMTRFVARQLSTAHWFDLSAARRELDYEPRISTEEGMRRMAEWLEQRANDKVASAKPALSGDSHCPARDSTA